MTSEDDGHDLRAELFVFFFGLGFGSKDGLEHLAFCRPVSGEPNQAKPRSQVKTLSHATGLEYSKASALTLVDRQTTHEVLCHRQIRRQLPLPSHPSPVLLGGRIDKVVVPVGFLQGQSAPRLLSSRPFSTPARSRRDTGVRPPCRGLFGQTTLGYAPLRHSPATQQVSPFPPTFASVSSSSLPGQQQ